MDTLISHWLSSSYWTQTLPVGVVDAPRVPGVKTFHQLVSRPSASTYTLPCVYVLFFPVLFFHSYKIKTMCLGLES